MNLWICSSRLLGLAMMLTFACAAAGAPATQPAILNGVGIDQKLGDVIPLNAQFFDESGRETTLRECVHGRPVLLALVYYKCPMLCTLTLNQLTRSLNVLSENAGESFDVLAVSFDPRETPTLAAEKKRNYLRSYHRPAAETGWRFLTGPQSSIDALTRSVGFRYRWDEEHQVFAHASGVIVVAPDGKITRYFLGVDYPPNELRQAIAAASHGEIGRPAETIFLYCFHYDPATGKYGLIISRAMRVLGVTTLCGLLLLIVSLGRIHRRRVHKREVAA